MNIKSIQAICLICVLGMSLLACNTVPLPNPQQTTNTSTPLMIPQIQLAWTGAPLTQQNPPQVSDMVWSPNGRYLAIASSPAIVLDVETNSVMIRIPLSAKKIVWGGSSEIIALGTEDQKAQVEVWNISSKTKIQSWQLETRLADLALKPDGSQIFVSISGHPFAEDGTELYDQDLRYSKIFDVATKTIVRTISSTDEAIGKWSPNELLFAYGFLEDRSSYGTDFCDVETTDPNAGTKILNSSTFELVKRDCDAQKVHELVWSDQSDRLLIHHLSGFVWTIRNIAMPSAVNQEIYNYRYSYNFRASGIIFDTVNNRISYSYPYFTQLGITTQYIIYNFATSTGTLIINTDDFDELGYRYNPTRELLVRYQSGSLSFYDYNSSKRVLMLTLDGSKVLFPHKTNVYGLAVNSSGTQVASAGRDGQLNFWDTADGVLKSTAFGQGTSLYSTAFQPSGTLVAVGSKDGSVRFWNSATKQVSAAWYAHLSTVRALAFNPIGNKLLTVGWDGYGYIWDVSNQTKITSLVGHTDNINTAIWNGEARVITGSDDTTIRIWDSQTGSELAKLEAHTAPVLSAALRPNGADFISADSDGKVYVWNAQTNTQSGSILGHARAVRTVMYSRDGMFIYTGSDDGKLRMYQAETKALLFESENLEHGALFHLAVTPDDQTILIATADGNVLGFKRQ